MERPLLLAHDLGTSGVKSSLVTGEGRLLDSSARAYATHHPRLRFREQDPEEWWQRIVANTKELLARNSGAAGRIAGIGVSGHMLGLVLLDDEGIPTAPALLHSDTRAHREAAAVDAQVGAKEFYRVTGNRLDPRSSVCKLLWVKNNAPGAYSRARRALQSKDYVVGRLTGRFESTDFSDASHGSFLDVESGRYAADLLSSVGIDVEKLPPVRSGTSIAGSIGLRAAAQLGLPSGVPVAVGAGDGSSASVGAGVVEPGAAYSCLGTTAWIAVRGGNAVRDAEMRVFNIMSAAGPSCDWFGTVQSAGASIRWAIDVLGIDGFDRAEHLIEGVPPGSDGVLFLPYLDGERSPIWNDDARGVWFGMSSVHTAGHLARAAMEGVAYALRSVFEVMASHAQIRELRFIGGGFRSRLLRQIVSDVLEVPLASVAVPAEDATALGAAMIAGTAVGLFDSLSDAAVLIPMAGRVEPCAGDSYREGYVRFRRLYQAVASEFRPANDDRFE